METWPNDTIRSLIKMTIDSALINRYNTDLTSNILLIFILYSYIHLKFGTCRLESNVSKGKKSYQRINFAVILFEKSVGLEVLVV